MDAGLSRYNTHLRYLQSIMQAKQKINPTFHWIWREINSGQDKVQTKKIFVLKYLVKIFRVGEREEFFKWIELFSFFSVWNKKKGLTKGIRAVYWVVARFRQHHCKPSTITTNRKNSSDRTVWMVQIEPFSNSSKPFSGHEFQVGQPQPAARFKVWSGRAGRLALSLAQSKKTGIRATRAHPQAGIDVGLGQDRAGVGGGARVGKGSSPNTHENSKYPKGTPLGHNFSYLNHSTFFTTFNVGLKSFHSFFFISFSHCIRPTSDLNISFIRKQNWTCEYTTFVPNGRITHSNHLLCIPSNSSCLHFNSSFPKFSWLIQVSNSLCTFVLFG